MIKDWQALLQTLADEFGAERTMYITSGWEGEPTIQVEVGGDDWADDFRLIVDDDIDKILQRLPDRLRDFREH